jgi:hypothetical protein
MEGKDVMAPEALCRGSHYCGVLCEAPNDHGRGMWATTKNAEADKPFTLNTHVRKRLEMWGVK